MLPHENLHVHMNDPFYAKAVAIVGMSCRFPEAHTLQEFWELLHQGKDTVTRIPSERWNVADYYDPSRMAADKTHQRDASMLKEIHDFDPLFFNISPAEAAEMHPSQKLMLELVWNAIESSGIPFRKIQGGRIGVYVGNIWNDFEHYRRGKNAPVTLHSALGQSANIIANRVSFSYGFTGPSMVVDTGCSASLVALHLACRSLWDDNIEMAVAAGVNHLLDPGQYVLLSKFGGLSAKGKCSAFDSEADGFVRGEGGGVLLLKKLSRAQKDGDKIFAVIRGTAVNNNGFNSNLPATSISAQREVLAQAYEQCGIAPHEIHYVEAHGTGTRVGDPIEARAIGEFFSTASRKNNLRIGSVKTNIGHLEGAAGIAGLIKVVLSMQHRQLPANLHFKNPNPDIPFDTLQLSVQSELTNWPSHNGESLKAGVNSFGWGGTNAHAVIEEYKPARIAPANELYVRSRYCLPLAARSTAALKAYAKAYVDLLQTSTADTFKEICIASAIVKPAFEHRELFTAAHKNELITALEDFIRDADEMVPFPPIVNAHKVVLVFPGQGAQWLGMGRELLQTEPVFRAALEACDEAFLPYTGWSLVQELHATPETSRLQEINVVQPVLCAVQIALARLWLSWGIIPAAVTGHSMGEVAAAHIAGALTLDQAACIICTRSALMKKVSGTGCGMMVTELSLEDAGMWMVKYPQLSVAVSNSPKSTVLAGDLQAINDMKAELDSQGIFCRPVKVDVASHSPQMDPLKADLKHALSAIRPLRNSIPIFSTVRNKMMNGSDLDAAYWTENLRNTVQFTSAMEHLMREGHTVFIEVSPHPVLLNAINECAEHFKAKVITVATIYREKPEQASAYSNLGDLYKKGYDIDWEQFYHTSQAPDVLLPGYPFQRERFEITMDGYSSNDNPLKEDKILQEEQDLVQQLLLAAGEEKMALVEKVLIRHVAAITKMPGGRIKPSMTFKGLGIDSLMAMQLKGRIEKSLSLKLSASTFWSHPSISEYVSLLTGMLVEERAQPGGAGTVSFTSNGGVPGWMVMSHPSTTAQFRIFCFHDAGGDASLYSDWKHRLGADFEVVAIELPGRGKRLAETPATDLPAVIRDLMPALEPLLDKPFLFFGHSLGGLLAFEVTRALRNAQLPLPMKLFISGMPAPADYPVREVEHTLPERELTRIFPYFENVRLGDEELFQLLLKRLRADLLLLNNYSYTRELPLPVPLVIIHGEDDNRVTSNRLSGWHGETSATTNIITRPGGHQYIEHDLDFLAAMIREETVMCTTDKFIYQ